MRTLKINFLMNCVSSLRDRITNFSIPRNSFKFRQTRETVVTFLRCRCLHVVPFFAVVLVAVVFVDVVFVAVVFVDVVFVAVDFGDIVFVAVVNEN